MPIRTGNYGQEGGKTPIAKIAEEMGTSEENVQTFYAAKEPEQAYVKDDWQELMEDAEKILTLQEEQALVLLLHRKLRSC